MTNTIHISRWAPWSERLSLPNLPGIYVISKESVGEIIYIGLTSSVDGLKGRVRQFHRAASNGNAKHAGGITYHSVFGPDVSDLSFAYHLPVAVNQSPEVMNPYIKYAERRLIWEFVERYGRLPVCNSE